MKYQTMATTAPGIRYGENSADRAADEPLRFFSRANANNRPPTVEPTTVVIEKMRVLTMVWRPTGSRHESV